MHLGNRRIEKSKKCSIIISVTGRSECVYPETQQKQTHSDFMVNTTAVALEAF